MSPDPAAATAPATLQVRLGDVLEIFNTLDPHPFRERGLDPDADDYLVFWAKEAPKGARLRIELLIPADEAAGPQARDLPGAVRRHFQRRAAAVGRELRQLLGAGRAALLVGLPVLAVCLLAASRIDAAYDGEGFGRVLAEGLVIAGWVANWRPIEIFLYDWWPYIRRRRLLDRLADADVVVIADGAGAG